MDLYAKVFGGFRVADKDEGFEPLEDLTTKVSALIAKSHKAFTSEKSLEVQKPQETKPAPA